MSRHLVDLSRRTCSFVNCTSAATTSNRGIRYIGDPDFTIKPSACDEHETNPRSYISDADGFTPWPEAPKHRAPLQVAGYLEDDGYGVPA